MRPSGGVKRRKQGVWVKVAPHVPWTAKETNRVNLSRELGPHQGSGHQPKERASSLRFHYKRETRRRSVTVQYNHLQHDQGAGPPRPLRLPMRRLKRQGMVCQTLRVGKGLYHVSEVDPRKPHRASLPTQQMVQDRRTNKILPNTQRLETLQRNVTAVR